MPRFQINCKSARPLVATLINIACNVVEDTQKRCQTVGNSVCSSNVRALGTDVVDIHSNATSTLGDVGALCDAIEYS